MPTNRDTVRIDPTIANGEDSATVETCWRFIHWQDVKIATVIAVALVVVAVGGLKLVSVIHWLCTRKSRQRLTRAFSGACTECGYSLVASTAICPECGTFIPEWTRPQLDIWTLLRVREDISGEVKAAVAFARVAAQQFGHDYLGTEHLLVGIMQAAADREPPLASEIGLELQDVYHWIESEIGAGPRRSSATSPPATPAAHRIFAHAMELMRSGASSTLQLRHLYQAMRSDRQAAVASLLAGEA